MTKAQHGNEEALVGNRHRLRREDVLDCESGLGSDGERVEDVVGSGLEQVGLAVGGREDPFGLALAFFAT